MPDALEEEPRGVLIDNRTDLPDGLVQDAVQTYFVENASVVGAGMGNLFQTYAAEGSLLARTKYQTPRNYYEEIRLARSLVERDDDIAATVRMMMGVAFSDGMENFHPDEHTTAVFNGIARAMNLDGVVMQMYREWLIAQQVTTVALFSRSAIEVSDGESASDVTLTSPRIGVLCSEHIRPVGNDLFNSAPLAYVPEGKLVEFLRAYFDPKTTAAQKAELRRKDPVSAAMFTGKVQIEEEYSLGDWTPTVEAYTLNPQMAKRVTAPKDGPTPRPLLTRNFALLEAKRLLNLMDYALLQGGMNFIVVAKKGSDERPALPEEVANLEAVIRRASRTGVIVGDHRLEFDIITPKLDELLSTQKRKLVGRKLAMAMLGIPEQGTPDPGQAGMQAELEMLARVIALDRHVLKRHIESAIYSDIAKRNSGEVKGPAKLWFPKIILQGANFFTDFVLKLRDRGDIPRKFAVEAAGFDWEAGVAQRKREREDNIDETMAPAAVPFSSPNAGPQDNNTGRPVGSGPDNGAPGARPANPPAQARPLRTINKNAGETVKAVWDEELDRTVRVGERTFEILAQYVDTREVGRITPIERRALEARTPLKDGPVAVIPVNPRYQVDDVRAVRLTTGLSMLLGERKGDGALVAKALCFREPEFDLLSAEEHALRWGFPIEGWEELEELALDQPPAPQPAPAPPTTLVVNNGGPTYKEIRRDADGNITGIVEHDKLPEGS